MTTTHPPDVPGPILTLPSPSPGFSFCIITNGQRRRKLLREIRSIRALRIPSFEILVGGEVPPGIEGITAVPVPEAARAGRLGEMRNRLVESASYDHIVVSDDDMTFHRDFYEGLRRFGEDYDVLCVRILNLDGSRYWDWATHGGPRGHVLLDYDEQDANVYVTGGLCVMKTHVASRVRWDEKRKFYEEEDVDFSVRLRQAGMKIRFCPYATVVHDHLGYFQKGKRIYKKPWRGWLFRIPDYISLRQVLRGGRKANFLV